MSQYFKVHPVDPQRRLLQRAVDIVRGGGIIVYPTDSSYAFGWHIGDKAALDQDPVDSTDWSATTTSRWYAAICRRSRRTRKVDNSEYRLSEHTRRAHTRSCCVRRTRHPKRLQDPKRRSIGIRVPDHPIAQALLESSGRAAHELDVAATRRFGLPLTEPEEVRDAGRASWSTRS